MYIPEWIDDKPSDDPDYDEHHKQHLTEHLLLTVLRHFGSLQTQNVEKLGYR
jgi:hypothetical protein